MVCGIFLRKMSKDDIFTLGLPQYATKSQGGLALPTDADHITLSFAGEGEGEELRLNFFRKEND
jgi:hypothetical protein